MVFASIVKCYRTPYNVVMDVAGVEMGGHHGLVSSTQQLVSQFHADLVGQLRRDLTFRETLDKMISLHAAGLVPALHIFLHVGKRRFAQAAQPRLKADGFGFVAVEGIVHRFFQ